ncbi:hypothetical protein [Ralstonia solanacearum]|uniref:hypothetical protein n=1 Tax=Ralstonia solanacearum TaxID=305 RepID=UPI0018B0E286|nr:hypothetical protein [Ralstonia solanacearum]
MAGHSARGWPGFPERVLCRRLALSRAEGHCGMGAALLNSRLGGGCNHCHLPHAWAIIFRIAIRAMTLDLFIFFFSIPGSN